VRGGVGHLDSVTDGVRADNDARRAPYAGSGVQAAAG
jgi:hypothetical protein